MKAKPIPDGYASLTPYLMVRGAAQAIDYYKKVFGATERLRMPGPGGMIFHAELQVGDSVLMLADEHQGTVMKGPLTVGGSPVTLHLYLDNVDETFAKAIAAGATQIRPLQNQFYGDRSGMLRDPFGHIWNLGTHVEDVSPEEMNRRMAAMKP